MDISVSSSYNRMVVKFVNEKKGRESFGINCRDRRITKRGEVHII